MKDDGRTPSKAADDRIELYQRQLRRLASELSLTEARERREIASDLHDHIGQALAFVRQRVSILKGDVVFSGRDGEFSEILMILDQAICYTRNLTVEISPPVLYELGLPAAIDWLAERSLRRYQLPVKYTESGTQPEVAENVRVFMFKAIQELINNVAKHAGATRVDIHARWGEDRFEIIVSDDGSGFDNEAFESGLSEDCCFGLFSIRERLSYIGGTFSIESSAETGTRVSLAAPHRIAREEDCG